MQVDISFFSGRIKLILTSPSPDTAERGIGYFIFE